VLQSFARLRSQSPGYRSETILAIQPTPPDARYNDASRRRAFYDDVMTRLHAIPGVTAVGAIHLLPFGGSNWNPELVIEGRAPAADGSLPEVDWRVVTPDYFSTLGVPLRAGRPFTAQDGPESPRVALVNETLARTIFAGQDPLGQHVYTFFEGKNNWVTIVGVVADTKDQTLGGPPRAQLFRPFAQRPMTSMAIMVRTTGEPARITADAERAVRAVDRDVPIMLARPLARVIDDSVATPRLVMLVLGAFGALALLLGGIGIYGVMAYTVSQRRGELGVRMALGAGRRAVVTMVLGDALGMALIGVALGSAGALALSRLLATQLYAIRPTDVLTHLGAAVILALVALIASGVPARRAASVEPVEVLR
jgi:predicted permease